MLYNLKILIKYGKNRYRKYQESGRLVIDFRGIEFMGRGFADEVFRVFQEEHPEIKITPLHASTSMLAMIRHLGGKQQ